MRAFWKPICALLWLVGCSDRVGQASYGDDLDDPQIPARGARDMGEWLARGFYRVWTCEPTGHEARPPSPHGRDRICNNDALHGSTTGSYPAGSASVKEFLDGQGGVVGYAVYRKVDESSGGDGWYWYEAFGSSVSTANGDVEACTRCHSRAPREYVFTQVP